MIAHAGCLALRIDGAWCAALLTGPSGAGKSDLALRLMTRGWRLVADDRTMLWASEGRLYGRAPDALRGLLEVRGLDVVARPAVALARVALHADCADEPERLPEPGTTAWGGVAVPTVRLSPLHASGPERLGVALFAAVRRRPLESPGLGRI